MIRDLTEKLTISEIVGVLDGEDQNSCIRKSSRQISFGFVIDPNRRADTESITLRGETLR
jgi:hypothetical protein